MSDIIKLLPDHIANQIAAGEVVQRPASVVKELIENSIDSGALTIQLVVKDGGRTLIQVIDNGSGMSDTDGRMCFERHATSKISKAEDLFQLRTKGFRGEALASIAAIAHVEMKTKLHDKELGSHIVIEGSKVVSQEFVACSNGTSISVKNLFFNIPARRNFLGSAATEYKHILNEFLRVALVHHQIHFIFNHNGDEIYNLPAVGLRQRIVHVFGTGYNTRLVPVEEETDFIKISGFITKPEFCRVSRDQMYFFVNDRYFKDRYFNHAVLAAFEGMIPNGKFPSYFLYFSIKPESIDVNVHPTKTEIKFEYNQEIYSILRSSIKQALGKHNIAPSLDFEQEQIFNIPSLKKGEIVNQPTIKINPDYNPFQNSNSNQSSGSNSSYKNKDLKPDPKVWENFYDGVKNKDTNLNHSEKEINDETDNQYDDESEMVFSSKMNSDLTSHAKAPYQIHEKYILSPIKTGFILIDQYRAHVRVLFERFLNEFNNSTHSIKSQKLLFNEEFEISATDLIYLQELEEELVKMGFEFEVENQKKVIISGVPTFFENESSKQILEEIIQNYKENNQREDVNIDELMALSYAISNAIRGGQKLGIEEMQNLIDELFACENPHFSPHGKSIIQTISMEEIIKKFN